MCVFHEIWFTESRFLFMEKVISGLPKCPNFLRKIFRWKLWRPNSPKGTLEGMTNSGWGPEPTRYKWNYNPYKWPYKWVTEVITPKRWVFQPIYNCAFKFTKIVLWIYGNLVLSLFVSGLVCFLLWFSSGLPGCMYQLQGDFVPFFGGT